MNIQTKYFGEIPPDKNKIIHFDKGLLGFENYKNYIIIYDEEDGENGRLITWLQSTDEVQLCIPLISPFDVMEDYNINISEELLNSLNSVIETEILVLNLVTIPKDIEKMSVNLRAPILINSSNNKGSQMILEHDNYPIKYPIYDILKNKSK